MVGPHHRRGWRTAVAAVGLTSLLSATPALAAPIVSPSASAVADAADVSVIVRHRDGVAAARMAVVAAGGHVDRDLGIIGGVAADVPGNRISGLADNPLVVVTDDAGVELHTAGTTTSVGVSLDTVRDHINATNDLAAGIDGSGVDIALIDSGITPVTGIDNAAQVVNGPDLSFEAGSQGLQHMDTYGHGTHLAGIINASPSATGSAGIAPGARIVSLKVADATGASDVSQVIAAIDWVVQNKNSGGLNIRVLALAFGTDGVQSSVHDPLAYAVEAAWDAGIVVIVAAGNSGEERVGLNNPATDRFIVSVAAADTGTDFGTADDHVPTWSSKGDRVRRPDVAAPGVSLVSLRVPGSYIDNAYGATAQHGEYGFKGSGTSQATAVTAAMAALMIQDDPTLRPDAVKYGLMLGARDIASEPTTADGRGLIDLGNAKDKAAQLAPDRAQGHTRSLGDGTLEGARGTHHVQVQADDGTWSVLEGEVTAFGTAWNGASWSGASWSGGSWSGASWSGASWSGGSWNGASWSGASWSGASWSGASWSGASWSGASWSGASWSGASWSGASWSSSLWM